MGGGSERWRASAGPSPPLTSPTPGRSGRPPRTISSATRSTATARVSSSTRTATATHCLSLNLTSKTSKGEGTIYTYSVVFQSRHPAFVELVPYVIGWIDLDEGFRMMSNIVGVTDPMEDIRIGQRVRVEWQDQGESGISLPMFRPI